MYLFLGWKLSLLINKAGRRGFLLSFKLRGRDGVEMQVTNLPFADDTLIFFGDSLVHLKQTPMWFEALLGLRINLGKS